MNIIKSTTIFYFSGTGNAKQVSLWLSDFANKNNISCQMFNIANTDIYNIDAPDVNSLIIIISPVHGFNFPKITLNFIRHFPKGNNNVVLMNTRAGMKIGRWVTPGLTGIAFMLSSLMLRKKGYKIVGQIPFDMPSNWISLHPALNENTVKYLHAKNYDRVEKHAGLVFSGKLDFVAYRDLIQDILIVPVSFIYYLIGRFAFAKTFYASIECDNCCLCIKQCPVKAIKMVKQHPYWTFKCESCMKCMNSCPKKAIETAHGLFLVTSIISSVIGTIFFDNILKTIVKHEFLRFILSNFIFFIMLWILYKFQHVLLKSRLAGKLISLMSLTHYKFWGRYKSIPDSKWKK